jgi:uncharacterized protein (TIGR03083 family)
MLQLVAGEGWTTRAELSAAADRFRAAMPGWEPPAAHGIAKLSGGTVRFPVVNVDAHGLPALALSRVCGHQSGAATYELTRGQLEKAIELLGPAEACLDYEHPNLWAWRELTKDPGAIVAVFLASLDVAQISDEAQLRLSELAQVRTLPPDIAGTSAPAVLDALDQATSRLVATIRENSGRLDEPSDLPGWSRTTVLAHLRYVAEAMCRITDAALVGRREDMYPGGRDHDRPRTLVLRDGESVEQLVDSVESTAAELSARWHRLSSTDWERRIEDRDHGHTALSRYLALRLTEVEVHSADLGLPELQVWSQTFVDAVLPLRLAWLGHARRRPDADLSLNGSWVLSEGETSWLVKADAQDVAVGQVAAERSAYCRITGTRRNLLALLLGRPAEIRSVGLPELAQGFKAAFPGP